MVVRIVRSAEFSPDHTERWSLTRSWETPEGRPSTGRVVFVMLNPSTADGSVDDPTIRRCMGFARSWDATSLSVVNLHPFRATNPRDILPGGARPIVDSADPIPADAAFSTVLEGASTVVLGWGTHGARWPLRVRRVLGLVRAAGVDPVCLGTCGNGHPKHPLYLRSEGERSVWKGHAKRASEAT